MDTMVFAFIVIGILFFLLITLAISGLSFAPWVPSWKKDLPRIFDLAELQKGETFVDLGCGDGRLVVYAARHFPIIARGVELALPMYIVCKIRQWLYPLAKIHFHYGNLFHFDVRDIDVIFIFGLPKNINTKLRAKLDRELKPGARVISAAFAVQGWTPDVVDKPTPNDITMYRYRR